MHYPGKEQLHVGEVSGLTYSYAGAVTVALPLAWQGLIAGFVLAFARSLGGFGATAMVAGNIEGKTQTIPVAIYSLANRPDGMEGTWRLVGLSILLDCAALAASEWMDGRRPFDVRVEETVGPAAPRSILI